MKAEEFIEIFQELIQTDQKLALATSLADIPEWDSMAIMAMLAWFDVEQGVKVTFGQLNGLASVADLARLAPGFEE